MSCGFRGRTGSGGYSNDQNTIAVGLQHAIPGQQDKRFHLCLRHQHAIERIIVVERQGSGSLRMRERNSETLNAGAVHEPCNDLGIKVEPAQCMLDGEFPPTSGTEEKFGFGSLNDFRALFP